MQANNNNAYWLTDYKPGDVVEIDFDLSGRQWGGKVFNNLLVEKITMVDPKGTQVFENMKAAKKKAMQEKNKYY